MKTIYSPNKNMSQKKLNQTGLPTFEQRQVRQRHIQFKKQANKQKRAEAPASQCIDQEANQQNHTRHETSEIDTELFASIMSLAHGAELPNIGATHIDRSYYLGNAGVLIFGWHYSRMKPCAMTVALANGTTVQILSTLCSLPRVDVVNDLQSRYPEVSGTLGFCCLVPLSAARNEPLLLSVDYGPQGRVHLRLPETIRFQSHAGMVQDMLPLIIAPEQMRYRLYQIIAAHLGPAIEAARSLFPRTTPSVTQHQFGILPQRPLIATIIPLFGRHDFLRHQLAQFASDPDFQNVDLVYVVDDPGILQRTLDLAGQLHDVFGVPFRILEYGENLGFAAANNIGVAHTHADDLLLLNSDVLPQKPGWLSALRKSLHALPQAGAVAPVLLYPDGAIQHAGMSPGTHPRLPGFPLNDHPGKGLEFVASTDPREQCMLTAACLLLRRKDFLHHGGFDEGYLVGDYEDSDLCLDLRKRGKRLWLVPEVRLWHLERQSQALNCHSGSRLLLTLFNSWRQQQKIRQGLLADPTHWRTPR